MVNVGGLVYEIDAGGISGGTLPSHTNDSAVLPGAASDDGTETTEIPITIRLIDAGLGDGAPAFAGADVGTVAGEVGTFTVDVTATVLDPSLDGTATVDTTVASQTVPAAVTTDTTTTTFQAASLTIEKLVRNVGAALPPIPAGGPYANTANGNSLDYLEYEITVTNTGATNATLVTVIDAIPAYTTYIAGSTTLNGVGVADSGGTSPVADVGGLLVDDGVSGPGVIGDVTTAPNNVAVVTFQVRID